LLAIDLLTHYLSTSLRFIFPSGLSCIIRCGVVRAIVDMPKRDSH
jgi:hypothetical protein